MKTITTAIAALGLMTAGAFAQDAMSPPPAAAPDAMNAAPSQTVEFSTVDTDGNGSLSIAEVQAIWPKLSEDQFKAADADGNGELSTEEAVNLKAPA